MSMSFLTRIFRTLRNPAGYVGRDLEGNHFFEYPSVSDDPRRTKRAVKYAKGTHMLDYVAGSRRLAVQWTSWLTHTRLSPPTLEELQADLERQQRIRFNAALIEARERAEAAQIAASTPTSVVHRLAPTSSPSSQPECTTASPPANDLAEPMIRSPPSAVQSSQSRRPPEERGAEFPSPWKPPPSDEPHSWQPRTSARQGD